MLFNIHLSGYGTTNAAVESVNSIRLEENQFQCKVSLVGLSVETDSILTY